jgi:hypothetical protein
MTTRNWPPGLGFVWFVLLFILGLAAILGTCSPEYARAQCPTPYCPGGVAVRVYDGGTGAHDAFTARRNLGINAASLLGLRDSLSSIYYASLYNPLLRVKDSQFWVKDDGDTTKQFQFQASGITTGTTRTYTMPNLSGTIPLLERANTFTARQDIAPLTDVVGLRITAPSGAIANAFQIYSTDGGAVVSWIDANSGANFAPAFAINEIGGANNITIVNKSAIAANRTYSLDNSIASTDFMMTGGTQTSAGAKTFSGASFFTGAGGANIDGTTARFAFRDQTDITKRLALNASAVTTATTRSWNALNFSGSPIIVGDDPPAVAAGSLGKVDLTAQTANITTTALSSTPPTGLYLVEATLMCTTAAGAAGTIRLTIAWTDNVGATTTTPINAFPLTATGRATGRQLLRVNSGDITYAVTVTGIYSTAVFAVYVRVISLG